MTGSKINIKITKQLAALGQTVLVALAKQFPVCMSSDTFHYFPQYRPVRQKWSRWDDFSAKGQTAILAHISKWQKQLKQWQALRLEPDTAVDLELLARVLGTLQEQFELVRPHRTHPTFYLSIASIGLAEALDDSYAAFGRRIETLPDFFRMAKENLQRVPELYGDMGITMAGQLKAWLDTQPLTDDEKRLVDKALEDFRSYLKGVEKTEDFRLPYTVYARIAEHHMVCGMSVEEIRWHLDQEIEEAEHVLTQTAARIAPGKSWHSVWQGLPAPSVEPEDVVALYQGVIAKLKAHCIEQRFFDPHIMADGDVTVRTTPDHLMFIRANAAYSMPAVHPPKGGTFYIIPATRKGVPRGMMLLAAHKTFPGRHLMDTLRWQLENPLRRSLGFPIFYEGWACFAEEILFDTDLFSGPADRLLFAKRRYWRAQRGRADLDIHTGRRTLEEAAEALSQKGLATRQQALAMVQGYALNPGYQLTYTIGRRKFRQLYTAFLGRAKTPAQFIRHVLSDGEIGFDRLAERMLY